MYSLSELHHAARDRDDHDHDHSRAHTHAMDAVQYADHSDHYAPAVLPSRSHAVDDHVLQLDLSGHLNTYLAPGHPYNQDLYAVHGSLHAQHVYDSSLESPYLVSQSEQWQSYTFSHLPAYSPQASTRDVQAGGPHLHYTPPTSAGHYSSAPGFSNRPMLSRHSSQRSWHSEQGSDQQSDVSQRASGSMHSTPLTTIPMLPILVGSNQSPAGALSSRDKKEAPAMPEQPDPFAARFLREQLGDEKWDIFTSRLAENRKNGSRSRMKVALTAAIESGNTDFTDFGGASAIDFLVKVEVVKGVLRAFVPHPYNPQKSMSHPYPASPKGHVVISRSSVLTLSGWSNTQFAYWARRAEGVSVLCNRDRRLRTVAKALERRLKEVGVFEYSPLSTDTPQELSKVPSPTITSPTTSSEQVKDEPPDEKLALEEIDVMEPERWVKTFVTGKGLDVIIDEVKKRCGVSQFLRGKHSSLDPFGATVDSEEAGAPVRGESAQIFMPTFQAESYVHEAPPGMTVKGDTGSPSALLDSDVVAIKRKASPEPTLLSDSTLTVPSGSLGSTSPVPPSLSSELSQRLAVPRSSSSYVLSESPVSPVSPLSPITPLSLSTASSSSSVPLIRQPSPTSRLQHTPVIVQASPSTLHSFDSPVIDTVCAKLNMQGIHLSDPGSANATHVFTPHPHSQPMTPLTPNGLSPRRSPPGPGAYHGSSHPQARHGRLPQEFELAQARSAQSFNLSIPQFPERKFKKQKTAVDHSGHHGGSGPTTPTQHAYHVTDEQMQQQQTPGEDHHHAHLRGFYSNMNVAPQQQQQQTGSGTSSPTTSWHGHSPA